MGQDGSRQVRAVQDGSRRVSAHISFWLNKTKKFFSFKSQTGYLNVEDSEFMNMKKKTDSKSHKKISMKIFRFYFGMEGCVLLPNLPLDGRICPKVHPSIKVSVRCCPLYAKYGTTKPYDIHHSYVVLHL